ncbi:MAG TPA: thiamine pyrophosphate-dependent enzyme, partial [Chloroflexota bacterium]
MLRAWHTMLGAPAGPVYVNLDQTLQEQRLEPSAAPLLLDPARYPLAAPQPPDAAAIETAATLLASAEFPVVLVGRGGQNDRAWSDLVALAEHLGAAVLTDLKQPAAYPTNHYLHQCAPSIMGDEALRATLDQADVVLALNWIDVAGTLGTRQPRLVNVSLDEYVVRSWSAEHFALPPAEVPLRADVQTSVSLLLEAVAERVTHDGAAAERAERRRALHRARRATLEAQWAAAREASWDARPISRHRLIGELAKAFGDRLPDVVVARGPLAWPAGTWDFTRPGAYLGYDGGAGIGSGPGMAVGAALALQDSGRPVVAVLGDGDLLMANTALWTAAHHRIPLLVVVVNNQTYFNDEQHQERVARARNRPVGNRAVGQRMDDPPVNFAGLARDLGIEGFGPVVDAADLASVYAQALGALDAGRPVLVDVHTSSE